MFVKKCYAMLLKCIRVCFGDTYAKIFDARIRFHKKLDLNNPKTLAEKVSWISVNKLSNLESSCTDKFAVRQYVIDKGLEQILIPLAGGPWSNAEEVDFEKLPSSFILKATHGCKMVYPVPDKEKLNVSECRTHMRRWLNTTYGTYSVEPHYARIPHRIYAEELLDNGKEIVDYKIHCLNGEPQFILVCSDRKLDNKKRMAVTLDLFDTQWNPIYHVIPCGSEVPGDGSFPKPLVLDEMLNIARQLSEDFLFVRVDLYESKGKVLFGELTFTPACGVFPYFTTQFIEEMGDKLSLQEQII